MRQCGRCGQTFDQQGTLHGQPASLWALLEHQEQACLVPGGSGAYHEHVAPHY